MAPSLQELEPPAIPVRFSLVFQQSQIVQRVINKIMDVITAGMAGDHLATTDNLDPVHIALGQNLVMAMNHVGTE